MGFHEPDWYVCEAIVGNTAETVDLSIINYLRVQSNINDVVYILFNWITGETEVSATNFVVRLAAYGSFEWKAEHNSAPKLFNVRIISATGGRVAFWGW